MSILEIQKEFDEACINNDDLSLEDISHIQEWIDFLKDLETYFTN